MKPVLRGAFAATMITFAFAPSLSGQTLLRLAPPEGQVNRYVLGVEVHVENPMMPTTGPVMTLRADQTQTIVGATEEVVRASAVFDTWEMTMGMPGAGPTPDLAGSTFTVEMDPRGRLLNIAFDETAGGPAGQMVTELLEGTDFFRLPEAEVASGDSWTDSVPVPLSLGGPAQTLEVEFTYVLTNLEDGQATITFSGPVESTLDMGGMPAAISGELSGSMIVDLAEGRYVRQESLTKLEMAVGGMAVPMETTTTLELVTDPN